MIGDLMNTLRIRLSAAIGVAAVAAAATGCTSVIDGSATRAAGSVTSDGVDLELLSTGNYPTTPAPAFGTAGTEQKGLLLEGARLGNYTVVPTFVDPGLADYGFLSAGTIQDTDALAGVIPTDFDAPNEVAAAAQRHDFVVGFGTRRYEQGPAGEDERTLVIAVLEFPDDAAAKAAATEMAAAYMTAWPAAPGVAHTIAGHADALAVAQDRPGNATVSSYTPRGRHVLYQQAIAQDIGAADDLVARTLDLQIPLIDTFEPTDPAQFADLPVDPSGLLARTIPADGSTTQIYENTAYLPAASLHFQSDPVASRTLYDEVGLVAVAMGDTTVYEAESNDGGSRVMEQFQGEAVGPMGFSPASGVMGMPNVACFSKVVDTASGQGGDTYYYCLGEAGKYAWEAISAQENDVHQKMAAQYLMLTAQ